MGSGQLLSQHLIETAVTMFETDKETDFKANTTVCVDTRTLGRQGTAALMFVPITFSFVLDDNRIPHSSADPLCTRTKHTFGISICLHSQTCF